MAIGSWEKINRSASLAQLADFLGLKAWLASSSLLSLEIWAAVQDLVPLWILVPVAIFTLGATFWSINQYTEWKLKRENMDSDPAYEAWDSFNEFRLQEAACLWDGKPLTSSFLSEKGLAIFRKMKKAINEKQISAVSLNGNEANMNTIVNREQLKALAGIWGERPPFLYFESRNSRR